jgi:CheY-like chemotaxis protein
MSAKKADSPKSVLIVDDERIIVLLWKDVFSNLGFVVHSAYNGSDAIDLLKKQSVDLVVTDLKMPGEGGRAIIKYVYQHLKGLKVVVCSGYIEEQDELFNYGVYKIISKPFDIVREARILAEAVSK